MNKNILLGLIGLIAIAFYILRFSTDFLYDEPYYLSNLDIMEEKGLGNEFIKDLKGPAGPLYSYMHYFLSPLTGIKVIPTRLVNFFLAILIAYFLFLSVEMVNMEKKNLSFLLFAIPMTYPCTGMALTEIPALFFFTAGIWVLLKSYTENDSYSLDKKWLGIFLSGFLISLSIVGRQPFLVCIPGFLLLFYLPDRKLRIAEISLFLISSLAAPAYLFYLWGGLVPAEGGTIATREPFVFLHFFLGLGYSFLVMGILAPHFFLKIDKKLIIAYAVLFLLTFAICIIFDFSFLGMNTLAKKLLPEFLIPYTANAMASVLIVIGAFFLHSLGIRTLQNLDDIIFVGVSVALLFILVTNVKVAHQFSSRYVLQGIPLFIILASYYHKKGPQAIILPLLGIGIGILSLSGYY